MTTQTFFRKATVSRAKATANLFAKFPNADLVSFEAKEANAEEARSAGVKVGEKVYAATIRVADFPPSKDEESGGGDDSAPEPKPKSDAPPADDSSDDSPDDSEPSGDVPDFGGGGDDSEGGDKPEKLSGEDLTNHILQQILDALKGGGPGADGPPVGGDDLGLPDVGAPGQGDAMPPPGPPGGKAPLPPPVPPKSPMSGGAFAHYNADQAEIAVIRRGANESNNTGLIREASEVYPTHKVAKIQRTGSAVIDGLTVDLAANKIAVVTLVQK